MNGLDDIPLYSGMGSIDNHHLSYLIKLMERPVYSEIEGRATLKKKVKNFYEM